MLFFYFLSSSVIFSKDFPFLAARLVIGTAEAMELLLLAELGVGSANATRDFPFGGEVLSGSI